VQKYNKTAWYCAVFGEERRGEERRREEKRGEERKCCCLI
jgi:hypothetical protein